MLFNRPPRIQTPLPDDEIQIPSPPQLPSSPAAMNWLAIGLPLGAVLLSVIMMTSSSGGAAGMSYLRFLPIMLATYLASGVTYFLGRRTHKRNITQGKQAYTEELRQIETELQSLQDRQREIRIERDPDLNECLKRAQKQDSRLGERRPNDDDFLSIRIGLGNLPTSLDLQPADTNSGSTEFKEQVEHAEKLYRRYSTVPGSPIVMDLSGTGSIGIAGQSAKVKGFTRALLCHLVTHHWSAEVQVAVVAKQNDRSSWMWTHALPHATSILRWRETAASDEFEMLSALLDDLESELQHREQRVGAKRHRQTGTDTPQTPLPRLIIVFDELPTDFTHPGLPLVLNK